jgi:hypothetical protein
MGDMRSGVIRCRGGFGLTDAVQWKLALRIDDRREVDRSLFAKEQGSGFE